MPRRAALRKASFWLPAVAMARRRRVPSVTAWALNGLGEVPGLAGQSPVNIARQLYLMATGERAGAWAVLMKGVVEKLTNDDIVAISAYIASLEP